jgi:hypothetical protein
VPLCVRWPCWRPPPTQLPPNRVGIEEIGTRQSKTDGEIAVAAMAPVDMMGHTCTGAYYYDPYYYPPYPYYYAPAPYYGSSVSFSFGF